MAASRISVEIAGESGGLQAAVTKAAESLKSLGAELSKQTDAALKAGDKVITSNDAIVKSYQRMAASASSTSKSTAVRYSSSVDEQVAASDRLVASLERTAEAASVSGATQVRASSESAAAAVRAATTHQSSAKKTEQAFGSSSSAISKAGKVITLGLLGAAAASVALGVKFEANTTRLQTQAGASAKQVDALRKGMIAMAAQVGYTPDQLANGMYHVVSSMTDAQRAAAGTAGELGVLTDAAKLAQVGHSDLEDTTYALVSALQALHLPMSDLGKLTGQVNAIVGAGDMTMTDFVDSLKSGLLPAAKTAGISLQSVGAAMDAMGDQGMKGSLAGTRLRMTIALLSSPSEAAAKVLDTLGLSSKQATSQSAAMSKALQDAGLRTTQLSADLRKPDGISYALEDLRKHLEESGLTATGAAAVMNKAFGGGRMGATITLLENSLGRVDSKFNQIGKGANAFGHDWQVQSETTAQKLHDMEGGIAALGTRIGTDLLPEVDQGIADLDKFAGWLEKGGAQAHALEVAFAAFAGVAVSSYLYSRLKSMAQFVTEMGSGAQKAGRWLTGGGSGGAASTGGLSSVAGGMGIGGAKSGFGLPGSLANPLIVAIEAGEYAGLGSMGAAGTVGTEEKAAAAESGAAEAATGTAAPIAGGLGGEAEAGLVGSVTSTLKSGLGSLLRGGLIAGGGIAASQLAGSVIGGKPGGIVKTVGTDTSIGAAGGSLLGPEGTAIGAIGGAIVGGLTELFKSPSFGDKITGSLKKEFGSGTQAKAAEQSVSSLLTAGHKLLASQTNIKIGEQLGADTKVTRTTIGPSDADIAKADADYRKAGNAFASQLEAGWNQYKFQSEPVMFEQFSAGAKTLPPIAQAAALDSAVKFSQGLEDSGRLAKGSTADFVQNVEDQFPGLVQYLGVQATASAQTVIKALNFSQAESNVQSTMHSIGDDFSIVRQAMDDTAGNTTQKAASMVEVLKNISTTGTGPMRQKATADLAALEGSFSQEFTNIGDLVASKMGDISASVKSGSLSAVTEATTYWRQFVGTIKSAEGAGLLTVQEGNKLIGQELAKALQALGVPAADAKKLSAQGFTVKQVGTAISSAASAGITGGQPYAQGGLIQFGSPGEKGRDNIPVNFAGTGIMVGAGEVGAVFTGQQQAVANQYMAPIGGLPGLFSNVTTPHYMATGGFVADPGTNFSVNQEPTIASDLNALAKSLGVTIYGISGYRSPAHSVAVGGFADDPHTKGEAADIGVNSQLRVSAAQITDAQLAKFGLYRPFDPSDDPSNPEVNHVQLLAGAAGSAAGVAAATAVKQITAPQVGGDSIMAAIVNAALKQTARGANTVLAGATSTAGGAAGPGGFAGAIAGGSSSMGKLVPGIMAIEQQAAKIAGLPFDSAIVQKLLSKESSGGVNEPPSGSLDATGPNQVIPSTFRTYALPGYTNINVPLDNAVASFRYIKSRYGSLENMASTVGLYGAGYVGYSGGGFTTDTKSGFPSKIIKPSTLKTTNPSKAKQTGKGVSTKDLQELSEIGGRIGSIESDLTNKLAQYSSLSGQFGVLEGAPQFLNADGTINAAGIQQATSDNQTLLGLANAIYQDYEQELPLVTTQLTKFLGKQSSTQSTITADKSKVASNKGIVAQNKLKEAGLRKGLLDLTKPTKNTVETIEDQIHKLKLNWSGKILAAEKRKLSYDESTIPRELSLEDAVIKAEKAKLGSSATSTADGLKQQVLNAEHAEKAYAGSDGVRKDQLSGAVNAARNSYSQFLLNQAPIKAALTAAGSNASLALRQYVQDEKPTQDQLTSAIANDRLSQQSATQPLEEALYNAQIAQQKKAQQTKAKSFNLRSQLNTLTNQDLKLTTTDSGISNTITSLKSVLAGAGGGTTGVNATVSTLETIAANLGTVEWNGGAFGGINTTDQGAAFNELTTIESLNNTLSQLGSEASGAGAGAAPDLTTQLELQAELTLQAQEGYALTQALGAVLTGFLPQIGAVQIPSYDKGGPILRDQIARVHEGEHVVPRGGALVMREGGASSSPPQVHVHVHGDPNGIVSAVRTEIRDPRNVMAVSKALGSRARMLRH